MSDFFSTFECPLGWAPASLGAFLPLSYGKSLTDRGRVQDGVVDVLGSSGVVGKHNAALTSAETIVVGRKGNAGNVIYSPKPCWPIDTTFYVEPTRQLDPLFCFHLLQFLRLGELDQSTAIPSLSRDNYSAIQAYLPPQKEQARIASRVEALFSDLDTGEENLRRAQAQLKRYRQSVLKAAVTGELTRAWREQNADRLESGEALLTRILKARREAWEKAELEKLRAKGKPPKDDAWKSRYVEPQGPNTEGLPKLPEGWTWATFVQIGEFGRGKSKHRPRNDPKLYGGAYPFLQTGTVRASNGRIRSYDSTYNEAGLAQSKLWPEGTICITIAANIAESGILDFPACFPDSIVGLVPSEGVVTEFIEFFIRTAREKLDTYAPATAQKNINLEILEKVGIPLPPTAEQDEIFSQAWERLSSIDAVEGELARQFAAVNALRQSILKAAFSGKLVPQDPNDEPASELLKRIAAERAAQGARPAKSATPRAPRKARVAAQPSVSAPAAPSATVASSAVSGLAAVRKAAGLSQAQLAERAGINQAYVSQMETGKRAITAEQAAALARALGIEPSALTQA